MTRFPCAGCGKALKAPAEKAGASARCPACGHKTKIPAASAAPIPPAAAEDDQTPNVELVDDAPPPEPVAPVKLAKPAKPTRRAKPAPPSARRVAKLIFSLVVIAVVLLASVWGGMAFKAGGIEGAPKSWAEFKARLFQEAEPEKGPAETPK